MGKGLRVAGITCRDTNAQIHQRSINQRDSRCSRPVRKQCIRQIASRIGKTKRKNVNKKMKHTEEQLRKLQTIRMTDVERVSIRTTLIDFMESTSPSVYQRIPSPFFRYWTPVMVTMCSFAFVIFGGSAVAYNASSSLPGDFLYNFKVHVNEEVAGIFIKSDLEKITFQQYRVAKRIEEVKKLAVEGELTAENAAIAEKNIDLHIAKIDESAKALAVTDLKEFVEVAKGLEPILDAHEKDLAENVKEALVGPGLEKLPEEIVQAPTMAVDPTATVDTKTNTKPYCLMLVKFPNTNSAPVCE